MWLTPDKEVIIHDKSQVPEDYNDFYRMVQLSLASVIYSLRLEGQLNVDVSCAAG